MPGVRIPIKSRESLKGMNPDYVIILAWNFAEPIMKMHQKYGEEVGQFILPMPEPEIVAREVV